MIRIGVGFDTHQLKKERKLIIGGVDIPYIVGLAGHSDAELHLFTEAKFLAVFVLANFQFELM